MKKKLNIIFLAYITIVLFLCLYNFSDYNTQDIPMFILGIPIDKIIHFTMFLPFPLIVYLRLLKKQLPLNINLFIFILGVLFAFLSELLQAMTKYRTFDLLDIAADVSGVLFGLIIIKIIKNKIKIK